MRDVCVYYNVLPHKHKKINAMMILANGLVRNEKSTFLFVDSFRKKKGSINLFSQKNRLYSIFFTQKLFLTSHKSHNTCKKKTAALETQKLDGILPP